MPAGRAWLRSVSTCSTNVTGGFPSHFSIRRAVNWRITQHAIVGKLRTLLADGIDSECEVVYLLCELRKLFDKTPARARPFALNMYRHWALHVDLSGTDPIIPSLRQVDDYIDGVLSGHEDIGTSPRTLLEFLFLDAFKSHLLDF